MGEIIKCSGRGCNQKISCYRYQAETQQWQLWFVEPPVRRCYPCQHYWQCGTDCQSGQARTCGHGS